ncbi:hypothetical protein KDL44_11055 [bacterium]|nr:hypothetical protein [bacterium]
MKCGYCESQLDKDKWRVNIEHIIPKRVNFSKVHPMNLARSLEKISEKSHTEINCLTELTMVDLPTVHDNLCFNYYNYIASCDTCNFAKERGHVIDGVQYKLLPTIDPYDEEFFPENLQWKQNGQVEGLDAINLGTLNIKCYRELIEILHLNRKSLVDSRSDKYRAVWSLCLQLTLCRDEYQMRGYDIDWSRIEGFSRLDKELDIASSYFAMKFELIFSRNSSILNLLHEKYGDFRSLTDLLVLVNNQR